MVAANGPVVVPNPGNDSKGTITKFENGLYKVGGAWGGACGQRRGRVPAWHVLSAPGRNSAGALLADANVAVVPAHHELLPGC